MGRAGKPLEMGAVELLLQPRQVWTPESSTDTWQRVQSLGCCSASHSHMVHVPNQSGLAKKHGSWGTLPFPCPVGLSPSDRSQRLAQRRRGNSPSYPHHYTPSLHPKLHRSSHAPQPLGEVPQKAEGRRTRIQQLARIKGERNAGKKGQIYVGFDGKALSAVETTSGERLESAGKGVSKERQVLEHRRVRKVISSLSGKGAVAAQHLLPKGWAGDLGALLMHGFASPNPPAKHLSGIAEPQEWVMIVALAG